MKRTKILQLGVLALLGAVALFGLFGCDIEEVIASVPRQLLHSSQTLLITPDPTSLAPQRLAKLAEASRHLIVLGPEQLDELFEDHAMIRQESA